MWKSYRFGVAASYGVLKMKLEKEVSVLQLKTLSQVIRLQTLWSFAAETISTHMLHVIRYHRFPFMDKQIHAHGLLVLSRRVKAREHKALTARQHEALTAREHEALKARNMKP